MSRLGRVDGEQVEAMRTSLKTLVLGDASALPRMIPMLRDAIGVDHALAYRVVVDGDHRAVDDAHVAGFTRPLEPARSLREWLRTSHRWGLFDPALPEPPQRNVVLSVGSFRSQLAS